MTTSGAVAGAPRALLRLEGLAVFLVSVLLYGQGDMDWILFLALFLAPDLAMLGYLAGARAGAAAYDAVHTYAVAAALALLGIMLWPALIAVSLVWAAHIGLDRALGFVLKYATGFSDTHLWPLKGPRT